MIELQRQSLIDIPREKTMEGQTKRKDIPRTDENNSLLYLLPAYLRSTPLVVLVPPFLLIHTQYPITTPSKFLLRIHLHPHAIGVSPSSLPTHIHSDKL